MQISIYDWVSQSLFTLIIVIATVAIIIYVWATFRKKERGRYNR